ncbi:MAG: hypothetical protein DMG57_32580 [Acidobacteria bacterium]|nr:MAG: hypothetical protein DMG57_32580 [Acidobacteriota bacterium]
MARRTEKSELDQALEDIADAKSTLEEAYTPESSREDLAAAVGSALETLEAYEAAEEEEEDDFNGQD